MRKQYVRLVSRAAIWSPRFGVLAFFLLLFSVLLQRFSIIYVTDFIVLITISSFFVIISLFLSVKALYSLWTYGAKGGMQAFKGIVYSLITTTPLVLFWGLWFTFPSIYDVSTDTQKPPAFFHHIRPGGALPIKTILIEQTTLQTSKWPEMSGRRYDGSPDNIRKSILNVLDNYGWPVVAQREFKNDLYIATKAKTPYLGFISDIMIRLTNEENTTFVDMRSSSRYMPKDFGANATFIIDFMNALDTEIASIPLSRDDKENL
ncbi:DUF1499 domain-containing protein [Bartonella sp. CB189]|uniref:DUF1499 domain-containing protein n=1 Tax=Bartonella sp. CB189 TaxID=3112254 RepID=UPI002F96DAD9